MQSQHRSFSPFFFFCLFSPVPHTGKSSSKSGRKWSSTYHRVWLTGTNLLQLMTDPLILHCACSLASWSFHLLFYPRRYVRHIAASYSKSDGPTYPHSRALLTWHKTSCCFNFLAFFWRWSIHLPSSIGWCSPWHLSYFWFFCRNSLSLLLVSWCRCPVFTQHSPFFL